MIKLDNSVLYKPAIPVDFKDVESLLIMSYNMLRLIILKKGIGLAAPQCGISQCIFLMRVGNIFKTFFNPKIKYFSEETIEMAENCLSFPGQTINIIRPLEIDVEYFDHAGKIYYDHFNGINARCFQHELDHLNGITFTMKNNNYD